MRAILFTVILGIVAGCSTPLENGSLRYLGYTMIFQVDEPEVNAGQSVDYTLWLIDNADVPVEGLEWQFESTLEPGIDASGGALRPVIAGRHVITASTEYDGATFSKDVELDVIATPAAAIDLRLSDLQIAAGDTLTWEVDLLDAWGNALQSVQVDVTVSDPDVEALGDTLTSTVPGTYVVSAEYEGLEDVEAFVVVPGPPAEIDLVLPWFTPELQSTLHGEVYILDSFGNPVDAPWTLTTDRPGATWVSQSNVTFLQEGWHTLTATVDGTTLSDTEGPFLIDSTGPLLEVTSPARATWSTSSSTTVAGTVTDPYSGLGALYVNGDQVTPAANGSFSTSESLSFGTNLIDTWAVDLDGNSSDDARAVLRGSFRSYGSTVTDGVRVRLEEGAGGLGTLEKIAEDLIASTELDDLIPSPLFEDESEWCTFLGCFTWYRVRLRARNPYIASSDLTIDPWNDGRLSLVFQVNNPRIDWIADRLVALEIGIGNQDGTIRADNIWVQILATPTVSNGQIKINFTASDVGVGINNLRFDWDSVLWDILSFFGVDDWINGLIRDAMKGAIRDAVVAEVPPLLAGALQDLELNYPFNLDGRTYTLSAKPSGVSVNTNGISLDLGTRVTVDRWDHTGWAGWGSLYRPYTAPAWSNGSKNTRIAFSGDLLNQVLYAVWGGGALDIQQSTGSLGLPADQLSTFLPGVTTLNVKVDPKLPPVVVPGSGSDEFELQIGDLRLSLYSGSINPNNLLIDAYVTAYAGMDLSNVGDSRLKATLGDVEMYFDVIVPEANTQAAGDTEALLQALVPLLLPVLTEAVGEIDIPSIQGFGINSISVGTDGSDDGYLTLQGNLFEE